MKRLFLLLAFCISLLTSNTALGSLWHITADNMAPTLVAGQQVASYSSTSLKPGDIIAFKWPVNPKTPFIMRVVGLPGDHISYVNKRLIINGHKQPLMFITSKMLTFNGMKQPLKVNEYTEVLHGVKHQIYLVPVLLPFDFYNIVVPKGELFLLGDNRDLSFDSVYWGFVPENDVYGTVKLHTQNSIGQFLSNAVRNIKSLWSASKPQHSYSAEGIYLPVVDTSQTPNAIPAKQVTLYKKALQSLTRVGIINVISAKSAHESNAVVIARLIAKAKQLAAQQGVTGIVIDKIAESKDFGQPVLILRATAF